MDDSEQALLTHAVAHFQQGDIAKAEALCLMGEWSPLPGHRKQGRRGEVNCATINMS